MCWVLHRLLLLLLGIALVPMMVAGLLDRLIQILALYIMMMYITTRLHSIINLLLLLVMMIIVALQVGVHRLV